MAGVADSEGSAFVRGRGTRPFVQWLEHRLPGRIVRHALICGWIWVMIWTAVAILEEISALPDWLFSIAAVLVAIPALAATAICLWATPRDHLSQRESILTHFVVRFVTVVFGFFAWTVSIVIGASISSVIQLIGQNEESQVLGIGIQLVVALTPFVATLLWMGLIIRCSWFLSRLRGWRARPDQSRIPMGFLVEAPQVRMWLIGLAHPGLLLVTGLLTVFAVTLSLPEATLNLDF